VLLTGHHVVVVLLRRRRLLARAWVTAGARFRRGGRPALAWAARLTAASVASYVLALLFFPGTEPLLAPLTALLVVQLTPVSLLASGLDRVLSVAAGVSVAAVFSTAVDLTWWSLAIVIGVSLLIGQALRLGSNLLEVPISAMLVLGVGSLGAESAAWQRITETLVGAGVGVASNLLLPPKVSALDAGRAIRDLFDDLAALLHRAADELADPHREGNRLADRVPGWLGEARALTHEMPTVGQSLLRAEESRRLNLRAVGTADPGPGLRQGMEALEHAAVTVRSLFRSLLDAGTGGTWPEGEVATAIEQAIAAVLREYADALRAFGVVVHADAQPGSRASDAQVAALREGLEGLAEARARTSDMVLSDADLQRSELNYALLTSSRRLSRELDLEERARRQGRPPSSPLARIRQRARRPPVSPPG
jgi:hypothetical protein